MAPNATGSLVSYKMSLEQIRALLEASQEVRFVSEAWLGPVLDSMLDQFPFKILGFHSDQ